MPDQDNPRCTIRQMLANAAIDSIGAAHAATMRRWAGSRWQDTGYVFTTQIGRQVDPRDLMRDYHRITRPKPKAPGTPPR